MLKNKRIVLGITGSIAAYKAAILVRLLKKQNADVIVLMTPDAHEFITATTMATLSERPVLTDFFNRETGMWNSHVDLAGTADLLLIAPATANTIAGMAGGFANNLLLATFLSCSCPVVVAPAMDRNMFLHPVTQRNIKTLRSEGVYFIEPRTGVLASGIHGKGRMEEPEFILKKIIDLLSKKKK